uniref:Putative helicase n=1 Tax=viral metagenome TaxID=1070528 RepID=A0A6M3IKW2_9ZZZZ
MAYELPMIRGDIVKRIEKSDEWAMGALVALHHLQTPDEQAGHHTVYQNMAGFNSADAPILSDILKKYLDNNRLSPKQLSVVKRALVKYRGQLKYLNIQPVPITYQMERRKFPDGAWARINSKYSNIFIESKVRYTKETEEGIRLWNEKVEVLRQIKGSYFQYQDQTWSSPLNEKSCKALIDGGFEIGKRLQAWYDQMTYEPPIRTKITIKGLQIPLMEFQTKGVAFIQSRNGRALIADEMGLGKTCQALAWVHYANAYPVLCIVPASVKLNWEREIRKFLPGSIKINILYGRSDHSMNGDITPEKGHTANGMYRKQKVITIINYDIIEAWRDIIIESQPKTVILDEVQYIKTATAKRTCVAKDICKGVDNVISLSGTPILNRPVEFFNCLNILDASKFGNFWSYTNKFCDKQYTGRGWSFSGAKNKADLHQLLKRTVMIRRLKSEVLKELPPKTRTVIPYEIDNRSEYIYAENQFIEWVKENYGIERAIRASNAEALAKIEYLKQLTVKGKMRQIFNWIDDFMESTEQKLIVFAHHRNVVDQINSKYGDKSVKIYGGMSLTDRQESIDKFQSDEKVRLLVGNIKSAGTGINLTAASTTCTVELGWTPAEHDQAEDRVHRIGQESENVLAYYLVAKGTIEEDIASLLDKKREVITNILDGQELQESAILTDLLAKYFKKEGGSDGK